MECRKYLVFVIEYLYGAILRCPHGPRIIHGYSFSFFTKKILIWEKVSLSTKKF